MKQIPVSALLAFFHSLVTTFPTLCTSLSSYSSTTIAMTIITYHHQWPNNLYCRQHEHSSNIPCNSCTTLPTQLVTS